MENNLLRILRTGIVLGVVGVGVISPLGCTSYQEKCASAESYLEQAERTGRDSSLDVVSQVGVGF